VESQSNDPETVFGLVGSLINKPPFVAAVPFNSIILSPIATVVELIAVVVPFTNKSPLIVTLLPVTSIAPLIELENVLSWSILFERDDDITPIDDVIELDTLLIELDNELDNVVILLSTELDKLLIDDDSELESRLMECDNEPDNVFIELDNEEDSDVKSLCLINLSSLPN